MLALPSIVTFVVRSAGVTVRRGGTTLAGLLLSSCLPSIPQGVLVK